MASAQTDMYGRFAGSTYDAELDRQRLSRQLDVVREIMEDGHWHTLAQLHDLTGYPEASISARIRDLRKSWAGGYVIEDRRTASGQWIYRVVQ